MAVTYTVTSVEYTGNQKKVTGTFTSAAGDGNGETLAPATHGLRACFDWDVRLDTTSIAAPNPKTVHSAGTITWTVDDTLGDSGRWYVHGR